MTNISNLNLAPNVTHLDLYDNKLTSILDITSLPALRFLDVSFNLIPSTSMPPISPLFPHLTHLYLIANHLSTFPSSLPSTLVLLEVASNHISALPSPLPNLSSLTSLYLACNPLRQIPANLSSFSNLQILSLQSAGISKIENLQGLDKVKELYLSENRIEKMENLEGVPNVRVLDLSSNRIEEVEGLGNNLEELWMSSNKISDWKQVDKFAGLSKLESVYLGGNPVSKDVQYRPKVMRAVTQLQELDAIPIFRNTNI